jgi:hypothetical protein
MWELAVIAFVLLLLVLILVIVACWISASNGSKKNKRSIELLEQQLQTGLAALQAAQTVCCAKAFLTVVGEDTVDRGPTGFIKLVNWDAQPANELPDGGWTPVISTIDQSLIGWTTPQAGTYSLSYTTSITTDVAVATLLVNGQSWLRSLAASAWDPSSPLPSPLLAQNLGKTFLLNLDKGDVLALAIFNLSGPGLTPPQTGTAGGGFVHSLTCDLRDAASQSSDNGPFSLPDPGPIVQRLLDAAPAVDGRRPPGNAEEWAASPRTHWAVAVARRLAQAQRVPPDHDPFRDSAPSKPSQGPPPAPPAPPPPSPLDFFAAALRGP